jgi:hypothetical protein
MASGPRAVGIKRVWRVCPGCSQAADLGDEQRAALRPPQGCRGCRAVFRGSRLVMVSGQVFPSSRTRKTAALVKHPGQGRGRQKALKRNARKTRGLRHRPASPGKAPGGSRRYRRAPFSRALQPTTFCRPSSQERHNHRHTEAGRLGSSRRCASGWDLGPGWGWVVARAQSSPEDLSVARVAPCLVSGHRLQRRGPIGGELRRTAANCGERWWKAADAGVTAVCGDWCAARAARAVDGIPRSSSALMMLIHASTGRLPRCGGGVGGGVDSRAHVQYRA